MLEFQKMLLSAGLKAKPVGADQLHFTLMFLGEISEPMLDSIKSKLVDTNFDPVQVTYQDVGAFPSFKSPRVIWIGVDDIAALRLKRLAREIEVRLSTLGFRSDKEFAPHITLFRVKDRMKNAGDFMEYKDRIFGSDLLSEVKVKKSDLTPSCPVYTDLFVIKSG